MGIYWASKIDSAVQMRYMWQWHYNVDDCLRGFVDRWKKRGDRVDFSHCIRTGGTGTERLPNCILRLIQRDEKKYS